MKWLISFILKRIPRKILQKWAPWGRKVIGFFLKGKNVTCPINGKNYQKFLPYGRGENIRENVFCPESLSLERHRLICLYLKNKTDFFNKEWTVLHIAPEFCFIDAFEKQHGHSYISADLESPWAKVLMNIEEIPFPKETFDFMMCNHVLEHVENDKIALQELYRTLKTGGMGIIQVPFYHPIQESTYEDAAIVNPLEREKTFGQSDHVRKYGLDYPQILEEAGFNVEVYDYVNTFSQEDITRYGLDPNEKLHIVRK